jgi:uncharacterized protein YgbK (DUF1537 family)
MMNLPTGRQVLNVELNIIQHLKHKINIPQMIAVIADDFTGAAELAGIALRYGLKVGLYTKDIVDTGFDVIIVSTDSRSLNRNEAIAVTARIIQPLLQLTPSIIYKKTDSVLRGHVVDELRVQMELQGLRKTLYLPANPSLGRTISDGEYFVQGEEISKTGFATDPEFSIKSSLIVDMLRTEEVLVLKNKNTLPEHGIVVGEVSTKQDILQWLSKVDDSFLLAGAGDAFECLLEKLGHQAVEQKPLELLKPHLYVSGTAFNQSIAFIKNVDAKLVHFLSAKVMIGEDDKEWFSEIASTIDQHQKDIIAIDDAIAKELNSSALDLRATMAKAVKQVIEQTGVKEIFIEGGSTAAAILNELNIHDFVPVNQISRGVIRMKAIKSLSFGEGWGEVFITVKPGSYQLPSEIIRLYKP